MSSRPPLSGIHHITFTVTDVERTAEWYNRVLGFEVLAALPSPRFNRWALRHPDMHTLLTIVSHRDATHGEFDETVTGLDHLAFAVGSAETVELWAAWLDEVGVDRSEVKDGAVTGSRLITFRDPDGIQIECYFA